MGRVAGSTKILDLGEVKIGKFPARPRDLDLDLAVLNLLVKAGEHGTKQK